MIELYTNSGDPDQTPCSATSDLGLHCLAITLSDLLGSLEYRMFCFAFNSFTATGNNNRLLQTALIQIRRLNEPSHLDLRCLTFCLSTLHINVFQSDGLIN